MKIIPVLNTASAQRPLRVISSKHTKPVYRVRRIGDASVVSRQYDVGVNQLYVSMNKAFQGKTLSQQSDMLEQSFKTINGANQIVQLQNPGFPGRERAYRILSAALKMILKKGGELITKTAAAIVQEALKQLAIWLGKILQTIINLVVNVAAEIIKYLLFGFIGGPWATLIPTILNILGPFIAVLSPLVPKVWNVGITVVSKGVETAGKWIKKFNDSQLKEQVKVGAAWLLQWLRNLGKPIDESVSKYLLHLINKV